MYQYLWSISQLRTTDIPKKQMGRAFEDKDNFPRQHFSRVVLMLTSLKGGGVREKYNS